MSRPDPEYLSIDQLIDEVHELRRLLTAATAVTRSETLAALRDLVLCGLSRREAEILFALADSPDGVVSRDDLRRAIYGNAFSETTAIDVLLHGLRLKLGGSCLTIRNHRRRGWSLEGDLSLVAGPRDQVSARREASAA